MVSIKFVVDAVFWVNLLEYFISILLSGCCEDGYLEYFANFFQELFREGTDMENFSFIVIVNQSFI